MSNNNNKLRKETVLPASGSVPQNVSSDASVGGTTGGGFGTDKDSLKARLSEIKTQQKGLNSEAKGIQKQLTKISTAAKKKKTATSKKKTGRK